MKVYLYYKEYNLGYLTYENNLYVWYPNNYQIKKAKEDYEFGMDMFFLPYVTKSYDNIPYHFNEYFYASSRADLKKSANILDSDSPFEKLYKMSKLDYFIEEFVIKDKKE